MQIKKYNISKPEKYMKHSNQGAEEKTMWHNIGEMVEFYRDDGTMSRIIKIPAIGLEASVFPIESKDKQIYKKPEPQGDVARDSVQKEEDQGISRGIEYPKEDIDINDIPF